MFLSQKSLDFFVCDLPIVFIKGPFLDKRPRLSRALETGCGLRGNRIKNRAQHHQNPIPEQEQAEYPLSLSDYMWEDTGAWKAERACVIQSRPTARPAPRSGWDYRIRT